MASFEISEFQSAGKLLEVLRLANPEWTDEGDQHSGWIFRGQGCASWKLLPKHACLIGQKIL